MVRFPRRIDIGFARFPIKLLTKKQMRVEYDCEKDDVTPDGFWDQDEETIYIGRWLPLAKRREVLLHELVHACLDAEYWGKR
jgi:Zn-dependent peptidase ImmA (M78 family)